MYRLSILLFAVAAVAGLTMAVMHFKKVSPPRPVFAVLHGLFAASGLVVLLLAVLKVGMQGAPAIALGLLVVAALGGFGLLSFHLRGRALPSGLVVGHALLAVAGFVTLLAAEFVLMT
jgi:glucose uptake protein GlcU